ncbi:retron St85 family effector protein [Undibacterium flavidum]|uniref:Uncharacterized protein n=1 Tax=Undibacterium flavidum TaxID=2762297 RepID=A0ABR6YG74_9BURK|nr:retron St85 family effector protein [Undibacterium flavidum]MBC3875575.1 hypothetical protein [Undibacterium flavidum]
MFKSIDEFAQAIDLQKSKVKKGPHKVTIFGGPQTDKNGQAISQRGIFLLFATNLADAFVVPEDFKNWNQFGVYDDLLLFEEDICAIADSVLIFLESAGAIAEFGTLIKPPEIASKLHIVINNDFHQEESFINHGLINHIKNKFDDTKITVSQDSSLSLIETRHIVQTIKNQFEKQSKEEAFKALNVRHVLHLIVDFIDLVQVAEYKDIKRFLEKLKLKYTKKKRLEQLLLTLKNIGLIREQTILEYRCFFILDYENSTFDYAFNKAIQDDGVQKKQNPTKRITWKTVLFEESQKEDWRRSAFKLIRSDKEKKNVA